MPWPKGEVRDVLSQIENAGLPYPSGPLLSSFVTGAVDPTLAARYLSARLVAEEARSVVIEWAYIVNSITENGCVPPPPDTLTRRTIAKLDGEKCCITGKAGTFWDPLLVVPILPSPSGWVAGKNNVLDMLSAFFGPQYRDWWLSYASDAAHMSPYRNHWLVRASAAKAFASGLVRLDRLQPSMIEFEVKPVLFRLDDPNPIEVKGVYALLGDHSRTGVEKVDARFVGTQARFSRSIRYLELAKDIAPEILQPLPTKPINVPPKRDPTLTTRPRRFPSLAGITARVLLQIWLFLPTRLRVTAYDILRSVGERLYGKSSDDSMTQRLPFGLYLKFNGELLGVRNEFNALQTVGRHTSIPVPKPLDVVVKKRNSRDLVYLLITTLPGMPLAYCEHLLSDRHCAYIAAQLRDYLAQLRAIPRCLPSSAMAICDTLGEACMDHRIQGGDPVGPFSDEATFSALLRFPDDPARRGHKIVFTHADLNPRNILVNRAIHPDGRAGWQVTGIVDWETAGYYPEYWDYTKSLFERFRWTRRYINMVKGIFAGLGDYSRELDVEVRSWEMGDGI